MIFSRFVIFSLLILFVPLISCMKKAKEVASAQVWRHLTVYQQAHNSSASSLLIITNEDRRKCQLDEFTSINNKFPEEISFSNELRKEN